MIKKICITFSLLALSTSLFAAETPSTGNRGMMGQERSEMMQLRQQCFREVEQDRQAMEQAKMKFLQHKQECISKMQQERREMMEQREKMMQEHKNNPHMNTQHNNNNK